MWRANISDVSSQAAQTGGTGDVAWVRYSGTRRRKSEQQRTQTSTYPGAPVVDPSCGSGYQALAFNVTRFDNTASGFDALLKNNTGNDNVASGFQALLYNTTGSNNTASGFDALISNTTGENNTGNGFKALFRNGTGARERPQSRGSNRSGHQEVAGAVHQ